MQSEFHFFSEDFDKSFRDFIVRRMKILFENIAVINIKNSASILVIFEIFVVVPAYIGKDGVAIYILRGFLCCKSIPGDRYLISLPDGFKTRTISFKTDSGLSTR